MSPLFLNPVIRWVICSLKTWSKENPVHLIIECLLGLQTLEPYVPPLSYPSGSAALIIPPDTLSSPSQRHHLDLFSIIPSDVIRVRWYEFASAYACRFTADSRLEYGYSSNIFPNECPNSCRETRGP